MSSLESALAEALRVVVREELAALPSQSSGWLDTAGAADYLSTTPNSIRDMVRRNGLPHHRAPGTSRLLFRPSELDAFVRGEAS